jgi:hypothetical protein
MGKYVSKFEASSFGSNGSFSLLPSVAALREFNMSTKNLEEMIDTLKKYGLDSTLLRDLQTSKDRSWRDLRKWKVENYLNRYNLLKDKIEHLLDIEDYFLELIDKDYRLKINTIGQTLKIYTKDVTQKSRLDKIAEVSAFLVHLNNTKRLKVELLKILDTNEFVVSYGDSKYLDVSGSMRDDDEDDEDDEEFFF